MKIVVAAATGSPVPASLSATAAAQPPTSLLPAHRKGTGSPPGSSPYRSEDGELALGPPRAAVAARLRLSRASVAAVSAAATAAWARRDVCVRRAIVRPRSWPIASVSTLLTPWSLLTWARVRAWLRGAIVRPRSWPIASISVRASRARTSRLQQLRRILATLQPAIDEGTHSVESIIASWRGTLLGLMPGIPQCRDGFVLDA